MKTANAPLFKDPIHNGAADPVVIYNEETGNKVITFHLEDATAVDIPVMGDGESLI